jgi:large subunit ribosomal protein L18e
VTDDERMLEVPKLSVCALRFTSGARERILKAGGNVMTLDQLITKNPLGTGTILLRAPHNREALSHFGKAPGLPKSHTRPYASAKGRNHEAPHKHKLG